MTRLSACPGSKGHSAVSSELGKTMNRTRVALR
jgi:hypothetical protein